MNKIIHPVEPEELMAYLDGELTIDRASVTAAHLGQCADCQNMVAELRSVSETLKTWKIEPSESAISPAIEIAIAERSPASRRISPVRGRTWREVLSQRWAAVAWASAVAAVFLVAGSTLRFPKRGSQVASEMHDYGAGRDRPATGLAPPMPGTTVGVDGRPFDKLEQFSKLQGAPPVRFKAELRNQSAEEQALPANGPMIIRTAQLSLITNEFDKSRMNVEAILKRHRGYVGELKVDGTTGSGRSLTATLHVPADQLDATLTEIKTLGQVESESQGGQDVTSQYVDLQARLANATNTEQRLTDLLRDRTGKLSDVLEVERELDRVRGEIEQMEAERKNMANQVSYATLNATITEDYKAQLQVVPPSTSTRLSNAAVEGYRSMADGVVSLALFLLSNGPSLLLWSAMLFLPARFVWKKVRRISEL
jgi:hypothetical protein